MYVLNFKITAVFLFLLPFFSKASVPFEDCFKSDAYVSGKDCYKLHNKPEFKISGWQFLEVPVDYSLTVKGKTEISYRLSKNFFPGRKTVLYFNGGPGGSSVSTNFLLLDDVNVIYFNQRGIAFSRPETQSLFIDQNYYSSENIARDALEIVKHLGVKKVTAYGMSYGTVPATIFGSLFPEYTENVILEGVIFDGHGVWSPSHRTKIIQRFFDNLDERMRMNILKFSRLPEVFSGWFSVLVEGKMHGRNFEGKVTSILKWIFEENLPSNMLEKEKQIISRLKLWGWADPKLLGRESLDFSPNMWNFITCKELDGQKDQVSAYHVFNVQGELELYSKEQSTDNACKRLNVTKSEFYSALNYPISVPVYYFQGTTDGATTANFAISHYDQVARGKAQLVLAKRFGHSVVNDQIMEEPLLANSVKDNPLRLAQFEKWKEQQREVVKIFKDAVHSRRLDVSKLNLKINDSEFNWVTTKK